MDFLKYVTCGLVDIRRFVDWFRAWSADRERPKPLLLTDLPDDIIKLILNKIPIKDRLEIRNVCHRLRSVADNHSIRYKKIHLQFGTKIALLSLDDLRMCYLLTDSKSFFNNKAAHIKFSFRKLKSILTISKLRLDTLSIQVIWGEKDRWGKQLEKIIQPALDDLKKFLTLLPHQLSVKHLTIDRWSIDTLHQILPYFKPGTLESIELLDLESRKNAAGKVDLLKEISQMDQWRQAKTLSLDCENKHLYYHVEEIPQAYELANEDDFSFIEEAIKAINPNQMLHLFAGQYLRIYWKRLKEQTKQIAIHYSPAKDDRHQKGYIHIRKR